MRVMGIESSCDETAVALLEENPSGAARLLCSVISTQIPLHRQYGGVIPELASRNHSGRLPQLIREALRQADCAIEQIDVFAATGGPGLVAALLVGHTAAKALALATKKPFVSVNHLEGHLLSPFLQREESRAASGAPAPEPHLGLIVSGGHSLLVHVHGLGQYELLGRSRDDAAGEAYDKVAKILDLPYPGGPEIDKLAELGDAERFKLPRPMMHEHNFNFSFSGLKTAVLYLLPKLTPTGNPHELKKQTLCDLCAGVRAAINDVLVFKSSRALEHTKASKLAVSGGVSCNSALRQALADMCAKRGVELILPPNELTTDNAAMIAYAGLLHARVRDYSELTTPVDPNPLLAGHATRGHTP